MKTDFKPSVGAIGLPGSPLISTALAGGFSLLMTTPQFPLNILSQALKDKNLSWKAKGIMAVFSEIAPPGSGAQFEKLFVKSTDGRSALRSGMNELAKEGYIRFERTKNEDGSISSGLWYINY